MGHWLIIPSYHVCRSAWWRHEMETFSALLAICAGNSRGWWFQTPSCPLWRHSNGVAVELNHTSSADSQLGLQINRNTIERWQPNLIIQFAMTTQKYGSEANINLTWLTGPTWRNCASHVAIAFWYDNQAARVKYVSLFRSRECFEKWHHRVKFCYYKWDITLRCKQRHTDSI